MAGPMMEVAAEDGAEDGAAAAASAVPLDKKALKAQEKAAKAAEKEAAKAATAAEKEAAKVAKQEVSSVFSTKHNPHDISATDHYAAMPQC
jgi:hypothetical protein